MRNDAGCYVRFATAAETQELYDGWAEHAAGAPERTDYGLLEFAVLDPDRNLLRIGGAVDS